MNFMFNELVIKELCADKERELLERARREAIYRALQSARAARREALYRAIQPAGAARQHWRWLSLLVGLALALWLAAPAFAQQADQALGVRGTGLSDSAAEVVVDTAGNRYLVGDFSGQATLGQGAGAITLNSKGSVDSYLAKLNAAGTPVWVRQLEGPNNDIVTAVTLDNAGNLYITGSFEDSLRFSAPNRTFDLAARGINSDVFVAKYTINGNFEWAVAAGGTGFAIGDDIAVNRSGSPVITGGFSQTAVFGVGANSQTFTSKGSNDIFVAQYDTLGNLIFARQGGGAGDDRGFGIVVDRLDGIMVTGEFEQTASFPDQFRTHTITSNGNSDIFAVRYSANDAHIVWLLGVGGPDVDFGLDIAANRFQEALVTGGFSGSVRFGGAGTLTSNGPSDLVVFKTDRTGLIVRAIRGGGPEGDSGIALATDASDNLFLAGRSAGRVTLGQGSQTLTTDGRNGDSDVLLAGFNPDLVPQFVQTAGGTAQDIGRGITVEGNGRIHISGMFNGGATFGSGAGAKTLTSQAGSDGFLARFTPATGDPVEPPPGNLTVLYMSSTTGGTIDGIRFQDEDILAFDPAQRRWTLLVDGSDIGLANTDVDAFHWASPNALFMSFNTPVNLPGIGPVDDSDVVRFVPTRLGANTTGQFQTFFNGRDAGLTTDAEDVDAFSFTPDGNLLISTLGRATVPGLNGSFQAEDEDVLQLIRRTPAAWNLLLDGSSEGLTTAEEDISAINLNEELFHLSTVGAFNALGVSGDGADALGCKPAFLAGVLKLTACSLRFDGSANGFGSETIDAFGVGETGVAGDTFSDDDGSATGDDTLEDDINEPETGLADQPLFLPLIVSND